MKSRNRAQPASKSSTARDIALDAVLAALSQDGFAAEVIAAARRGGLPPREAALASQIALGTVRHSVTIAHVLRAVGGVEPRRTPPALWAVLLAAAYQLIWMDGAPAFAVVDEAVSQARRRCGAPAAGMANAVLRNLGRAIAAPRVAWRPLDAALVRVDWERGCQFSRPVLPQPSVEGADAPYWAAATGEKPQRFKTLCEQHGREAAIDTAWASQAVPAIVLHRNTLRVDAPEFSRRVHEEYGAESACESDAAFLPPWSHVHEAALFREGLAYVQDTTAHAAAVLVDAQSGERVLDLCAAPGGKTLTLAIAMGDRGELLACDPDAQRLERVTENLRRMGLACVRTQVIADTAALSGEFDAALVDAPCSNTGVIARRPEARLAFNARKVAALADLQGRLLRQAAGVVRPGGRLVYSTCSIEPEENERVAALFVDENRDWRLEHQQATRPRWGPRWADWRDGGFAALLRRA